MCPAKSASTGKTLETTHRSKTSFITRSYFFVLLPCYFIMLDAPESLHWQALIRPHGSTERALGKLAFALESSPLHGTWLWREIARAAVMIAQAQELQGQQPCSALSINASESGREASDFAGGGLLSRRGVLLASCSRALPYLSKEKPLAGYGAPKANSFQVTPGAPPPYSWWQSHDRCCAFDS